MVSDNRLYNRGRVDVSVSGWIKYPGAGLDCKPLTGPVKADVAIVGAGLAGCALALFLAEGGADVAVVEAREPAWGASGRNGGEVATLAHMLHSHAALPDKGEAFLSLYRQNLTLPFDLVQRYQIDCDAVQGGFLHTATGTAGRRMIERLAKFYGDLKIPVEGIDRDGVDRLIGSDRFEGGLLQPQGGRINPYYYTRGLARAAEHAGAKIFSYSPVHAVDRRSNRWHVVSERGSVEADNVVMCTGAYDDFGAISDFNRSWCPMVAYVITSKPLHGALRHSIMPCGGSTSNVDGAYMPILVDGLGRLTSASLPGWQGSNPRSVSERVGRWMRRFFPQASGFVFEVDSYWTGVMAWATDHLPKIYDLGPGLLALNSFSAEGNLPAPMIAKNLAENLLKGSLDQLAIPLQRLEQARWRQRHEILRRGILVPLSLLGERLGVPPLAIR